MMILVRAILLFVFMSSLPVDAATWSVADLVARYVEKSPALAAAKAQSQAAVEMEKEAFSGLFPEIYISGRINEQQAPLLPGFNFRFNPNRYSLGINLEQPIYTGGRVFNAWKLRQIQRDRAKYEFFANKNTGILGVVEKALRWVSLAKRQRVLESSRDSQREFLRVTENKSRRGLARDYELAQAQADFHSYAPQIESLQQEKRALAKEIREELDLSEDQALAEAWPPQGELKLPSFSESLAMAERKNPDLKVAESDVKLADRQKSIDAGEHRPSLSFLGSFGYETSRREDIGEEQAEVYTAILALKIPLFSGLSSVYSRRKNQAMLGAAESSKKRQLIQVRTVIRKSLTGVKSAQTQVKQAKLWESYASKALRLGEKNYRAGVIGSFQRLQLQATYERAAVNLINSQLNVRLSYLRLRHILGDDLEQFFVEAQ